MDDITIIVKLGKKYNNLKIGDRAYYINKKLSKEEFIVDDIYIDEFYPDEPDYSIRVGGNNHKEYPICKVIKVEGEI